MTDPNPRFTHPLPALPTFHPPGLSALASRNTSGLPIALPISPSVIPSGSASASGSGSVSAGGGGGSRALDIKPRPGFEDTYIPRKVDDRERGNGRRGEEGGRGGGSKRPRSLSPPYRDRDDRDRSRDRYEPRRRLSPPPSKSRSGPPERERPGFIKERSPLANGSRAANGGSGTIRPRGRSHARSASPGRSRSQSRSRAFGRDEGEGDGGEEEERKRKRWEPDGRETLLSYRDYASWAREWDQALLEENDRAPSVFGQRRPLSAAYHAYRNTFSSRQLWALYLAHRDEAWFKEKYADDPEQVALRERVRKTGRVPAIKRFLVELEEGKHEGVNFDAEPTSEIPATLGPEFIDDKGLAHVRPGRNQVFIKAIPVDCTRDVLQAILEQAGKVEYIAIGDPIQKRSFMRAGWAQYEDGTNMSKVARTLRDAKIGDFALHITENTVDHLNKVRQTPGVCSTTTRYEADILQAKALVIALEEPLRSTDVPMRDEASQMAVSRASMLTESGVPAVEAAVGKVLQKRGLNKGGLTEAEKKERSRIELDHWLLYLRRGLHTCYYCVSDNDHEEELYRKCIRHLRSPATEASETAARVAGSAHGDIFRGDDVDEPEEDLHGEGDGGMDIDREREADHVGGGSRTVNGGGEMGPVELKKNASSERRWFQWVDKKIRLITHRSEIDPAEYYGRNLDAEKLKISLPLIKREDEGKWRCMDCAKMFKAPEFLYKHVPTKHPGLFRAMIADTTYFNSFCLDPQHLIPHRLQPASVNDKSPKGSLLPPQQALVVLDQTRQNGRGNRGGGGHGGLLSRVGGYANEGEGGRRRDNREGDRERRGPANLDAPLESGNRNGNKNGPTGGGGNANTAATDAKLLAPPAVPDDPRAGRGRMSYRDLDAPGAGLGPDAGGLPY